MGPSVLIPCSYCPSFKRLFQYNYYGHIFQFDSYLVLNEVLMCYFIYLLLLFYVFYLF